MTKNSLTRPALILLKKRWQMLIAWLALFSILLTLTLRIINISFADIPLYTMVIIGGIPFVIQILMKLLSGDLGADSLAGIAVITAVILGEFLAANLIILMLSGGQTLEGYAQRKASSVLNALVERMPTIVHLKVNGKIEEIELKDVKIGNEIIVYPHEVCPIDGIVIDGHGSMDESYLTGEPYQISKAPGTSALSGAINGETPLTIRTNTLPSHSRYAAIVKVLEEAEQKRPTLRRLGDQIGAIFAPIALLLAFSAWYVTDSSIRFLSVLVIATPCPLLIAIPIAIISAISMAARQSIIIKDPTVLERLPTCRTAIFDKTGTLTYGKPEITKIITHADLTEDFILQQVASLERYSKHPLAIAIINAAKSKNLDLLEATEITEKPGFGLTGSIKGHQIQVTSRKKLHEAQPQLSSLLPPVVPGLECVILYDGDLAATFFFHDVPRTNSLSFIRHLAPSHQFEKIMLVSGDRESEVKYFGESLQFTEMYASQSPEQKLAIVREETKKAPTLFMGDGINDAPALTAATVGVAFGEYSNVTAESAGAVIMENTLNKVDELMHLSIDTRKVALQSAIGGMIFSFIGMGFAAAGYIPPVAGAILQEFIDIFAIINSLRLTWGSHIKTDLPTENTTNHVRNN